MSEPRGVPISAAAIGAELRGYSDQGVIEYYLSTIPEGEQYVVGVQGQILKMDTEQAICFLAGAAAAVRCLAERAGLRL